MTSTGTANRPSLFARLYDAWRLLLQFGGLPQSIDASLVPCHRRIPEDLRAISGHMAVHARLVGTTDSPCSITMELSDQSPVSVRQLRAIGHTGRLTVTDSSYRLHDAAGAQVDQKMEPDEPISFAQLIACQWIRLLDRPVYDTGDAPGPAEDAVTACCMACLLSAHTHQPESPQRLLEVHRRL